LISIWFKLIKFIKFLLPGNIETSDNKQINNKKIIMKKQFVFYLISSIKIYEYMNKKINNIYYVPYLLFEYNNIWSMASNSQWRLAYIIEIQINMYIYIYIYSYIAIHVHMHLSIYTNSIYTICWCIFNFFFFFFFTFFFLFVWLYARAIIVFVFRCKKIQPTGTLNKIKNKYTINNQYQISYTNMNI
jgi:hypothetical protein